MKRCAIITNNKIENFNHKDYDLLIGVESGSKMVCEFEKSSSTMHIGDYDSVEPECREMFAKLENSIIFDHDSKEHADGEEAIKLAIEKGYKNTEIDIYVKFDHRQDHFLNMINVIRKYGVKLISKGTEAIVVPENINTIINKKYELVSIFSFEETKIKTKGLRWEIDEVINIETGTKCISNMITGDSFEILADKKVVVMLV